MLRQYNSIPKTVLACMIEDTGTVTKIKAGEYKYEHKGKGASMTLLVFQTSPKQEPKTGDFIMYENRDDIYLCPADVFHGKYRIQGGQIL